MGRKKASKAKQEIRWLACGQETDKHVDLIISLTSINSESTIKALKLHLVNGVTSKGIDELGFMSQSNFSRDLQKLDDVANIVEQILDSKWVTMRRRITAEVRKELKSEK